MTIATEAPRPFTAPSPALRFTRREVVIVPAEVDSEWQPPDRRAAQAVIEAIRARILLTGQQRGLSLKATAREVGVGTKFLGGVGRFWPRHLSRIAELVGLSPEDQAYVRLCLRLVGTGQGLQWSACALCEIRMLIPAWLLKTQQFCDRECQRKGLTRSRASNELRRYLRNEMRGRGVKALAGMARAWGVSTSCVVNYYAKSDRVLTQKVLLKIAAYFEVSVESLIEMQGGVVAEQRWGAGLPKDGSSTRMFLGNQTWLGKRGAAISRGKKGKPMSASHKANVLQVLNAPGEMERRHEKMAETKRLPESRMRASILAHRQHLGH